ERRTRTRRSSSPAMAERIVINTGPLVALGHAGVTSVVARLPYAFLAPTAVRDELERGRASGFEAVDVGWVTFQTLKDSPGPMAIAALAPGEAAVIQLALEEGVGVVCLDERRGRRAATAVGLRVTGTLGLLGRAKTLGLVPEVRPLVARMIERGDWFDSALV